MDTNKARLARRQQLTNKQQAIIFGCLLGDGYLTKTTRGFALRINHGKAQKPLVDWKFQHLKNLTNSTPNIYHHSYYFRSVSHPYFMEMHCLFYKGQRKVLPHNIDQWLTPLALSVWIMDDGARDKNQLRLNTQSFSKKENLVLIRVLEAKLGIITTLNRDKNKYRLRVSAQSMPCLKRLVLRYIIPSMLYKFSL